MKRGSISAKDEKPIDLAEEYRKIGKTSLDEAIITGKRHTILKCTCGSHSWAVLELPFDPTDDYRDDRTMFVCLTCNRYRVAEVSTGQVIGAPYFLDKYSRERQKAFERADTTKEGEERQENWFIYPSRKGEEIFWTLRHGSTDKKKHAYVETDYTVTQERLQWFWSKIIRHLDRKATAKDCFAKIIKVLGLTGIVTVESFNGGKNRALYYFPYYYYPMKVLHYIGYIKMEKGSKNFERVMNIEEVIINPAHEIYNADKEQTTLEGFNKEDRI